MPEFGEEIPVSGGKLEFVRDSNDRLLMTISGSGFRSLYQIAVSNDGQILGVIPPGGLQTAPPPPPPMTAWIQSDQQGMWGRRCPSCQSYFRTDHIMANTFCPYCSKVEDSINFITGAQRRYAQAFLNAQLEAARGSEKVIIDLDNITDATPEWQYQEEQQQFHFKCTDSDCQTQADILGEYGWCPRCGRTNGRQVIETQLQSNDDRFVRIDRDVTDRLQRGQEWELINNIAFSSFEALGNHLRSRLILFPATPVRRQALRVLSFQRLVTSAKALKEWCDIDLFKGIDEAESKFLQLMLQRRHIVTHNAGRVDQDYLSHSGDTSTRLNQRIRIRSSEVKRMLPLVRRLCTNVLDRFESIN
jgi:hypothetical protein